MNSRSREHSQLATLTQVFARVYGGGRRGPSGECHWAGQNRPPLGGWRHVNVTTRRTKADFAGQIKELVDEHYPDAVKTTLVMDNLNTHRLSCLYEAFPPEVARRLIERIEVVHTPKHGSWLNMAECELSVLEKQALGARVSDEPELREHVTAWASDRNNRFKGIEWQFQTADARTKLRRLYPKITLG